MNASVFDAIRVAQDLTTPDSTNYEYIRGQADLICHLFGLSTDEWRDEVIAEIRQQSGKYVNVEPVREPLNVTITPDARDRIRDLHKPNTDLSPTPYCTNANGIPGNHRDVTAWPCVVITLLEALEAAEKQLSLD
jgi:hypothetical protein